MSDTSHLSLILMLAFIVKHFVCDFPLQAFPWMYRNKGTYGHPGGFVHAGIHLLGTLLVFTLAVPNGYPSMMLLALCWADFIAHYHIDWAKIRLGVHFNLRPDNSEWFWILLGLDQLLHYLTYIGIVWVIVR